MNIKLILLTILLFTASALHAQPQAPCKDEITRAIPRKACEKAYPDHECLPLPKEYSPDPHFKCVEKVRDGAPIFSEECPEGEVSHTEKVCEELEVDSKEEPECYELEYMCQPVAFEQVKYNAIIEDDERIVLERSKREEAQARAEKLRQAREAWEEEMLMQNGRVLDVEEVRQRARGGN